MYWLCPHATNIMYIHAINVFNMKENPGIPDYTYDNKSSAAVVLGQKKKKKENCAQAELISTLKTKSVRRILPWKC